ncbi:MAG: SPFH domain-containing protein [Thermoplasmata archaeon]|nr:SPFH domain-containing protein [Thermoplasmata archaeon]
MTALFIGLLIVGGIMALILAYASRYKKVPPDKAMVVYGRKIKAPGKRGYEVISGGGKFIYPIIESYEFLPLDVRTLDVNVRDIVTDVTTSGAKLNVKCVTQVKISSDMASLHTAAEQLLHKSDGEINEIAMKTLEGHVRGVCATMTIEEINSDRDKISIKISNMAAKDLMNMGIEIRSFVIKEIEDEHGYLEALGIKRTEEVKRDARIGKANANRQATIQEAKAAQEGEQANAEAEAQVAVFHRDRDITRQKAEAEVEKERANREISFAIQDARRKQELIVEERTIDIRDKEKSVEVERQEVLRRTQEQEAVLVVPAKAKADSVIAEAEGEKTRMMLIAEGEKQQLTLVADGQAEKIRREGTAEADIIRLKGLAEADAIRAKGLAEAEAMEKKALAWEMYGKAALTQLIVEQLPAIVGEASKTLMNTEKIIVMGEGGPSKLVSSIVDIAAQAPALVKTLTGMDIGELVQKTKELIK